MAPRCLVNAPATCLVAWLLSVLPAAAAVSEREPAAGALWLSVVGVSGMSWVMACRRWWLPFFLWVPVALLASEEIAHLLDPVIGRLIRDELGAGYIFQADLCGALVVVVPLLAAHTWLVRRKPL